uniref:Uncharacterized protein LOC104221102 n=1 Tax=Nicotiana sylvestris TaxID=4096 RepID=A0A1U7W813_NICSY
VPSSFTEVKETVGPFNSIYSFRDSLSSVADHVAATLNLPSPQPYTQRGTEFFESGLNFATPGVTFMKPFFFLKNDILAPP